MAPKMHAAVVEQFGKPLSLLQLDVPSPGAGQILVKTEACGVCHTDLHAAHGDWPVKPTLPFIPGHEAIGLVAAVGSDATIVKEGDRVGVPWLYSRSGQVWLMPNRWVILDDVLQANAGGKNYVSPNLVYPHWANLGPYREIGDARAYNDLLDDRPRHRRIDHRRLRYPHAVAPDKQTISSRWPHFFHTGRDLGSLHLL